MSRNRPVVRQLPTVALAIAAGGVGTLLIPTALHAQDGHRVMIMDDGNGPNVMHFTMPDFHALREPSYVTGDLPIFNDRLELNQAQQTIVQKLLEDYIAIHMALLKEKMPQAQFGGMQMMHGGDGPNAVVFGGGPDGAGGPLGEIMFQAGDDGDFTIDIGEDGAWSGATAVRIGIEVGDGGGMVGQDVDVTAGGPQAGVFVAIEGADGEELPDEVREAMEKQAQEIAEKLMKQLEEGGEGGQPRLPMEMPSIEDHQRRMDEMAAAADELEAAQAKLTAKFIADVRAQLDEHQDTLWPRFDRAVTRKKTLPKGRLDGERTDLTKVLAELELADTVASALEESLESYEIALHDALVRRNAYIDDASREVDEAIRDQKPDAALNIVDRATKLRLGVRAINEQYTDEFAYKLSPDASTRFRNEVLRDSYPRVYRKTRGERAFEAARRLEGIDEDTLLSILEIEGAYRVELDAANERIRRAIRKYQPGESRRSIEQIALMMAGQSDGIAYGMSHDDDPIHAAFKKRREIDASHVKRLYDTLTPEQVEKLPKIPSKKSRPLIIERFSGGDGA